ncbi:FimB/Mfa2 family fimbrial subunit [uncultured Bacteroides sp.]|uniref:FimB/Mfa2 family fimbrial subunit n=1 Tax=uncultured Bacteroides sp. TaxID=162156 RepID=UPI0025DC4D39|nr:FimB/Mfa2 family fimbrial subunit [uncultured Bacteroides sp.]
MKTRKLKIAYAFLLLMPAAALLQTSCSDNEPDDVAAGQGNVEVTANWDDYSEEAELPGNYTLAVAGIGEQAMDTRTATFSSLLDAGTYELAAYNIPANMTVDNLVATVALHENGTLQQPGYLFSNTRIKSVVVEPGKTVKTSLKMKQRVRKLTLALTPKGGDPAQLEATELEAVLSGIASTFNIATEELSEAKDIELVFKKQPSGSYSATIYILGVVAEEKQELTFSLDLSLGRHYNFRGDLTDALKYFGNDIAPLSLKAHFELPGGIDGSGTILPWEPEFEDGPEDVELH